MRCFCYWLVIRSIENIFHNLSKNFVVGLLQLHSIVINFICKANQLVYYLHDILRVISILPVSYLDVISHQKVEFLALAIINCLNLRFDPFADSFAGGKRILLGNVVKYLVGLKIDKFD